MFGAAGSSDATLQQRGNELIERLFTIFDSDFWDNQPAVEATLDGVQHALTAAEAAFAAALRAPADRRANIDLVASWTMNPVAYANGLTAGEVDEFLRGEPSDFLGRLGRKELTGLHEGGLQQVGKIYHVHTAGGSKGFAFTYLMDPDGTVTPYILDLGDGRGRTTHDENTYRWRKTGGSSHADKVDIDGLESLFKDSNDAHNAAVKKRK